MPNEIVVKCATTVFGDLSTAIAACTAVVAAVCAYFSYSLSKRIYDEIKSDEVIVPGTLHHPGLRVRKHDECVLRCSVFNKSPRKAYINSVEAFDSKGVKLEITWSDNMDELGTILNPTELLGIVDAVNLCMRRNDGEEFGKTTVSIQHSFSSKKIEIVYDPYAEWECMDEGKSG
ncbi:MAG: hypothetical protein KF693_10330 [Nitrospira sp.]|nr:hypothetical protein [Nitrospira sp.]